MKLHMLFKKILTLIRTLKVSKLLQIEVVIVLVRLVASTLVNCWTFQANVRLTIVVEANCFATECIAIEELRPLAQDRK